MRRFFAAVGAAALLSLGGLIAAAPAGAVVTPLQVTLSNSQGDAASALFNASGDPVLTPGTLPYPPGTFAEVDVNDVAGTAIPATEPTFHTDNFAAGSPRWVLELSNGSTLFSNQNNASSGWLYNVGHGWTCANTTGSPGSGTCTYANAVAGAVGSATGVTVTDAFVVADGDQTVGTHDTITGLQYNGETLGGGCAVTITQTTSPQNVTEGAKASIQIMAVTNTSDKALSYSATGLPSWLSINSATGLITGTAPSSTESDTVHVKVTNTAYDNQSEAGCHAFESFAVNVTAAPAPTPTPTPTPTGTTTGGNGVPSGGVQTGGGLPHSNPTGEILGVILLVAGLGLTVGYTLRKVARNR